MFDSIAKTTEELARQAYIADVGLSTSLFLALKMEKALFLEGELETVKRLIASLRWRASERKTRRLVPKTRGLGDVESFLFGTRLTRITPQLEIRNIDRAIDQASRQVIYWSGGTRIGESLHVFNRRWSRRVLRRGAVVLILSDGWERGDVSVLRQEMAYLQRRCHRLIWLNPLLGKDGYQPLVEGMAVALPHVDDFLPVHNLEALEQLADVLAGLPSRRSGSPAPRVGTGPVLTL